MDTILWWLNAAWKILAVFVGILLFKAVLSNGAGTIRELAETIGLSIRAACAVIRRKLVEKLRKETGQRLTVSADEYADEETG